MTLTLNRPTLLTLALVLGVGLIGWLAGQSATANNAAVMAPATSVAFVRLDQVLDSLDERNERQAQLTEFIAEREAQLQELVADRDDAVEALELLRPGTAAHREKAREVLEIRSQLETRQRILQEIIALETGRILAELYTKIKAAVGEIAQRDGYDLVVHGDAHVELPANLSQTAVFTFIQERKLIYAGNQVDITDDVGRYMNNAFQAGGSSTP
ncbi:MAG: OmpH family outer membrane protein [Planctomycetota bacterium]